MDYSFSKIAALDHVGCTKVVAVKIPFNKFAVDMGLSVKWSAFNLGATSCFPVADTDEARHATWGDYYAWGETAPYYVAGHAFDDPNWYWEVCLFDFFRQLECLQWHVDAIQRLFNSSRM